MLLSLAFTALLCFVSVATAATAAVDAPLNTRTSSTANTITIMWTPGAVGVVSQRLQVRRGVATAWADLAAALGPTVTTYMDSALAVNSIHAYRVQSIDGSNAIASGAIVVDATSPTAPPPLPVRTAWQRVLRAAFARVEPADVAVSVRPFVGQSVAQAMNDDERANLFYFVEKYVRSRVALC